MNTYKNVIILLLLCFCSSEKETPQIQTLIDTNLNHNHNIIISIDEIKNEREDFYTTENLNHRHKVLITKEDREKLLQGLKITKETEESLGHKHQLEIKIFDF
ncbi:MAG: hypothetical protein KatS3mg129_0043 [Leptospiraceae bacterium]|nr:MAG: hypothetical protein KatS3mg129_0043 [Leptospiraceae bacterium]